MAESSPPDRSHYSNDRTDEYFLLMRKFRSHLTKQERQAVVQRVVAKDADSNWIESYRKIAETFNVTVPCISQIARRAGIAPRCELRAPKIRFHPPPQLYGMYATLVRKVGASHAKQMVQEHIRIRGIYDPSTRVPERRGGDDSNMPCLMSAPRLLCPDQRTLIGVSDMSPLGQKQTFDRPAISKSLSVLACSTWTNLNQVCKHPGRDQVAASRCDEWHCGKVHAESGRSVIHVRKGDLAASLLPSDTLSGVAHDSANGQANIQ